MTDAEKIEWLTATNNALMESQERLAGEVKELRERNKSLHDILNKVNTIPDAVQFWRSRAELERVEAFIKLIEMLPKEY